MSSDHMQVLNVLENNIEAISTHTSKVWMCEVKTAGENQLKSFIEWFNELDKLLVNAGIKKIIDVAISDGCKTSNGHALLLAGRPTAWVSVSNYPSKNSIRVFATHEVIHAVHYGYIPDYYFDDKKGKNHVGRQLVTEGVATYVTQKLLNISESEALWSDYLDQSELDQIMKRYQEQESQSASNLLEDWDMHDSQYFYSADKSDVDTFRSGYYIGRKIIEDIVRENDLSIPELLTMERQELDDLAVQQLKAL